MNNITTNNTSPVTLTQEEHTKLLSQINPQKILDDSKDKIQNQLYENAAFERAAREPLPSVTNDAFNGDFIYADINNKQIKIRKMYALDITIFKLIDSPFYKLIMGDVTDDGDKETVYKRLFNNEEVIFQIVYQFTNDVKEVYRQAKKDKQAFYDIVIEDVGTKYTPSELVSISSEVLKHIGLVNKAKVEFDASVNEDDKKKQLTQE